MYAIDTHKFTFEGHNFEATLYSDDCMSEPWKECDGHGIVSEWTTRDKAPGEMVLCKDGRHKRYYDFQATVKLAKRDGWNVKPYNHASKGEQAHKAVMADFQRLRDWCNNEWFWATVEVTLCDDEGDKIDGMNTFLGGVESDYWTSPDILHDMASEIIAEHESFAA